MEKNNYANPGPLGLMGFGLTTVLLNIHNAGFFPIGSMVLSMGIFMGGLAQIFAGLCEFKKGNTFGLTAFTSYGLFWWSLVALILMQKFGWTEANDVKFMGWYLFMWGVFSFVLLIATFKAHKTLQIVFALVVALFWLLAARDFTGSETIGKIAGWEGILCGLSAMYLGAAEIINEKFGKEVLPL